MNKKDCQPTSEPLSHISLYVPDSFLAAMAQETLRYYKSPDESEEASGLIYGLQHRPSPDTLMLMPLICFTIPEETTHNRVQTISGGPLSADYADWLKGSWPFAKARFLKEHPESHNRFQGVFDFLGWWHSQPGSVHPSENVDDKTVHFKLTSVSEGARKLKGLLFPIVAVDSNPTNETPPRGTIRYTTPSGVRLKAVFYYREKNDAAKTKILPTHIEKYAPILPEKPWYVANRELYNQEYNAFFDAGFEVTAIYPLFKLGKEQGELWFELHHHDILHPLHIGTAADYHVSRQAFLSTHSPLERSDKKHPQFNLDLNQPERPYLADALILLSWFKEIGG